MPGRRSLESSNGERRELRSAPTCNTRVRVLSTGWSLYSRSCVVSRSSQSADAACSTRSRRRSSTSTRIRPACTPTSGSATRSSASASRRERAKGVARPNSPHGVRGFRCLTMADGGTRRPSTTDLEAAAGGTVPDVVAPRLSVLFCGINPGLWSAAVGRHFARPGNRFWKVLHAAGFTSTVLDPADEPALLSLDPPSRRGDRPLRGRSRGFGPHSAVARPRFARAGVVDQALPAHSW